MAGRKSIECVSKETYPNNPVAHFATEEMSLQTNDTAQHSSAFFLQTANHHKQNESLSMIQYRLSKLCESILIDQKWHITHQKNSESMAEAINDVIYHMDSSLPQLKLEVPPSLQSVGSYRESSETIQHVATKSEASNENHRTSPYYAEKITLDDSSPVFDIRQKIMLSLRLRGLYDNFELDSMLFNIKSAEEFQQLDKSTFSSIFPLLCKWLMPCGNPNINFSRDTRSFSQYINIDEFFSPKVQYVYTGFLLLYEGVRHFPQVFLERCFRRLIDDVMCCLGRIKNSASKVHSIGLASTDIENFHGHLVYLLNRSELE